MAGFFGDFAEGFLTTGASVILDKKKRNEDLDDKRKEAIIGLDVQDELDRRKEARREEQRAARQKELLGTDDSFAENVGTDTAAPKTLESVFQEMQKYTQLEGKFLAAGDEQGAKYYKNKAEEAKQQMDYMKSTATLDAKPITGAEGTNIVEGIQKQLETDIKNKTSISQYYPTAMNKMVNDPTVAPEHQRLNQQHQSLAQAVASARKEELSANTPEVATTLQRETQEVIKNVNTIVLDDPRITPEMKRKAAWDIENYFETMSPIEKERLTSNPNFQSVFTPDVRSQLKELLATPASAPTQAPTTKPAVKQTKKEQPKADLSSNKQALAIKAQYKAKKISREEALKQLNALK